MNHVRQRYISGGEISSLFNHMCLVVSASLQGQSFRPKKKRSNSLFLFVYMWVKCNVLVNSVKWILKMYMLT